MVAHFTNNTVAVLLTFGAAKLSEKLDKVGINQAQSFDFSNIPTASLVIAIVFYALMFLGFVAGFVTLIYAFYRSTEKESRLETVRMQLQTKVDEDMQVTNNTMATQGIQVTNNTMATQEIPMPIVHKDRTNKFSVAALIGVLPGVILIFLTFVGQILELMNVNSGLLYNVLKALWLV